MCVHTYMYLYTYNVNMDICMYIYIHVYTMFTMTSYATELAGGCRIEKSYFDQENWCVVAIKE